MTVQADPAARAGRVSAELQHAVEQFLYYEAELLDTGRLREWLELVDEDIEYQVGTRPTVEAGTEDSVPPSLAFEDDKQSLTWRVKRLETGMAWAEEPPSRTRYLITNVRITPTDDTYLVHSNFMLYRNRLETMEHLLVGSRKDILRPQPTDPGFVILRRAVTLDQNVVLSNNLSMLF